MRKTPFSAQWGIYPHTRIASSAWGVYSIIQPETPGLTFFRKGEKYENKCSSSNRHLPGTRNDKESRVPGLSIPSLGIRCGAATGGPRQILHENGELDTIPLGPAW